MAVELPPFHSRLFNITPIASSSHQIQGLTSYISILANEHSVSLYDLISFEILPLLNKPYLHTAGPVAHRLTSRWWWQLSSLLNGHSYSAELWVAALEQLTRTEHLARLTMLPWRNLLSNRGLIRPELAFCPLCYYDQRRDDQVNYNPLLWSLRVVQVCPDHLILLSEHCLSEKCRRQIPPVSSSSRPGFCPYCQCWLGSSDLKKFRASDKQLARNLWVARCCEELIEYSTPSPLEIPETRVADTVDTYINTVLNGNAKAFARQLGMHHKTVYDLREGQQTPQLGTLLKISAALGTTPLALLIGQYQEWGPITTMQSLNVPLAKPRKGYQSFNKAQLRRQLTNLAQNDETPPPSMAAVAKRIGYDQSFLQKHFPDECAALSERHHRYVTAEKIRAESAIRQTVKQAVYSINVQGMYPSHKRLAKLLGGALRDPVAREARKQALWELGYET